MRPTAAEGSSLRKNSGVEHVVVLMMENRSFDSFFGLASRCAWTDTGVSSVDRQGVATRHRHSRHSIRAAAIAIRIIPMHLSSYCRGQ